MFQFVDWLSFGAIGSEGCILLMLQCVKRADCFVEKFSDSCKFGMWLTSSTRSFWGYSPNGDRERECLWDKQNKARKKWDLAWC